MCLFENEQFLNIFKTYKEITFPIVVPVVASLAEKHWHKVIHESSIALKAIIKETDPDSFEKALET